MNRLELSGEITAVWLALGLCWAGCGGANPSRPASPVSVAASRPMEAAPDPVTTIDAGPAEPTDAGPPDLVARLGAPGPDVSVAVDARVEVGGRVVVRHRLPLGWAGVELPEVCLSFAAPGAPEPTVHGLGPGGQPTPWRRCRPASASLETRFVIDVAGRASQAEPTGDFGLLLGRRLVPRVQVGEGASTVELDLPVQLTLRVPDGSGLVTSPPLQGEPLRLPSTRAAREVVFVWGRLASLRVGSQGASVQVVGVDVSERELQPLAELLERALATGTGMLGVPRGISPLVVVTPDEALTASARMVDSVTLRGDTGPSLEASSGLGRRLLAAATRLWVRGDRPWLDLGLRAYLAWRLGADLDSLDEGSAMDLLMRRYGRYRAAAGVQRVLDAETGPWAADAGALTLFCADAELHREGQDLLRLLRPVIDDGALRAEELFSALERVAPAVASHTRARLRRRGPVDLGPCLAAAGHRLQAVVYRDLSVEGQEAVLRAIRNTPAPPTVGRPRPSSGFQRGDRLVSVGGVRLRTLSDLGWALRLASLGDRLRFRVLRDGRRRVVVQRSPNLDEFARPGLRWRAVPDERRPAWSRWISPGRGARSSR